MELNCQNYILQNKFIYWNFLVFYIEIINLLDNLKIYFMEEKVESVYADISENEKRLNNNLIYLNFINI